jgi:hypothetical protein
MAKGHDLTPLCDIPSPPVIPSSIRFEAVNVAAWLQLDHHPMGPKIAPGYSRPFSVAEFGCAMVTAQLRLSPKLTKVREFPTLAIARSGIGKSRAK